MICFNRAYKLFYYSIYKMTPAFVGVIFNLEDKADFIKHISSRVIQMGSQQKLAPKWCF